DSSCSVLEIHCLPTRRSSDLSWRLAMAQLRVAVDVGGTFTDVCIFDDEAKSVRVTKVPSTPDDPMVAVMNGVERGNVNLADVSRSEEHTSELQSRFDLVCRHL